MWKDQCTAFEKENKQLKKDKESLTDKVVAVGLKGRKRLLELQEVRKTAQGAVKHAEENASLLKQLEALVAKDQQREGILKTPAGGSRRLPSENGRGGKGGSEPQEKARRQHQPHPSQIKLLVRPQQVAATAAGTTIYLQPGRHLFPRHCLQARDLGTKRIDGLAHPTSANVDGFNKSLDPILNSPLTSFQSKADITSEINTSSDYLKLGRNNELVFHRSMAEDQLKVIRKAQA